MNRIAIDFCYEENGYLGIHEWSIGKNLIFLAKR